MYTSKQCRFCDIMDGIYQYDNIDRPFASNDEFYAVASIGAMIEGWSLVVPKKHQLSMKKVYGEKEFLEFMNSIIPTLMNTYGSLIAFEHGSNKEGSITSCGTDHAHLHLVPFEGSLLRDISGSDLKWIQCPVSEIDNLVGESEYLFYYEIGHETKWVDPVGCLHVLKTPISQYFRHVIAKRIGISEKFDYKKYPFLEKAELTKEYLSEAILSRR